MMIIKLPHFHMMIIISSQDHLDGGARPPPGQAQLLLPRQAKALPCCSTSITACHHSMCMLCRARCGPGSICALRSTQNSWLAHTDSACIAKHRPNDPLCKQFVAVVPKHTPKNKMYSKSRKIHSTSCRLSPQSGQQDNFDFHSKNEENHRFQSANSFTILKGDKFSMRIPRLRQWIQRKKKWMKLSFFIETIWDLPQPCDLDM